MAERTPPPPDPLALNHAAAVWTEDHRVEEATIPRGLKAPEDAAALGHLRLTADLLFKRPVAPREEEIMRVVSAVSERLLDLHDSLWEDPDAQPLGLKAQFVRYDGPVEE